MDLGTSQPQNSTEKTTGVGLPINRLQTQIVAAFVLLAMAISALLSITLYLRARSQMVQDMRDRLIDDVRLAVLQVNPDTHSLLIDPQKQQNGSLRMELVHRLQLVQQQIPAAHYVYTLRLVDNQLIFILDAATAVDEISYMGDIYDSAPPETIERMRTGKEPWVLDNYYTDDWGTWLSGYAPIITGEGRVDGWLAIDMEATPLKQREQSYLIISLIIFLATIPLVILTGWFLGSRLATPLVALTESAKRIAEGELNAALPRLKGASIPQEYIDLANSFTVMTTELRRILASLEERVADRTQELDKRAHLLEAAAAVGQSSNSILDPDELIQSVVDQIRESFDLYYVGLFFTDESGEQAILRSGTGAAGQAMLLRGHRITVGSGMVGWAIANNQARVALEAGADAVRLASSELPDTRSEAALPLRSRGKVIGALTVQSTQENAFDDTTLTVLQTMADQVAIALENARLYGQAEESLAAAQRAFGEISRQDWVKMIRSRQGWGYRYSEKGLKKIAVQTGPLDASLHPLAADAQIAAIPIVIRDERLGVIKARKPEVAGPWRKDELALLETLVGQLTVALESARLFQDTQLRAAREQLVGDVTSRMRETLDVDAVLQTAAREMRRALGLEEVELRLASSANAGAQDNAPQSSAGKNGSQEVEAE